MVWLWHGYLLHALFVLAFVLWGARLERKSRANKDTLRTLVKIIDRDLDELREEHDGQMIRVAALLIDIRDDVRKLLDQKDEEDDQRN